MGIRALVVVSFFALLGSSGCGSGVSGENGSDPFGSELTTDTDTETFTIVLAILDQQCGALSETSFSAGETVCVQATLNNNGESVAGQIIGFDAG